MPMPTSRRRFQYSLATLLTVVTIAAALAGALRWLVILTCGPVATAVVAAILLVAIWARTTTWGFRLLRKWERRREVRVQRREAEAIRKLLERPELREAITAAKIAKLQHPADPPATDT
jgi:hypothetical protein